MVTHERLLKHELLQVRSALLDLKLHLTSLQIGLSALKYRPDQPRMPRGQPEGGQWTNSNGNGGTSVAGRYDPSRASICDAQLELDEELCRVSKSPICWSLAVDRHAACMKNNYIPPLRF